MAVGGAGATGAGVVVELGREGRGGAGVVGVRACGGGGPRAGPVALLVTAGLLLLGCGGLGLEHVHESLAAQGGELPQLREQGEPLLEHSELVLGLWGGRDLMLDGGLHGSSGSDESDSGSECASLVQGV